ncbi:MAG: AMP-binding protein, partial [Pseudomonadota bacterium]|nr:AMP-binding protein [Pseudomonadota bacterium]
LAAEEVAVWDVMHTTGTTTGKPAPFYSTAYDFYKILSIQEGMMQLRGVSSDNLIANLFPLTISPHGAYARVSDAAAAIKVPVINVLPGSPSRFFEHGSGMEEAVRLIEQNRATILWGVPSYVRRLLIEAADLGADFSAVRFVFITGESAPEALRADFRTRLSNLGAIEAVISISYGATEMQGGMVECQSGSGFHNPAPDQFHVDIVDPETHQPVPKGERGLVLISHLDRRGTVLLRYSIGDISTLASGPCPHCGSETERLSETPIRSDSLIKIKGTLVNPAVIEEILLNEPEVQEFQIVIERLNPEDPLSPDHLRLRIAGHEADIVQKVKEAVGVTPGVEISEPQEIFAAGNTLKSRRVVDTRK